jgi:hypothetical protein
MRHDEPPFPQVDSPKVLRGNANEKTEPASPATIFDRQTDERHASKLQLTRLFKHQQNSIQEVALRRKPAYAYRAAPHYLCSIFGKSLPSSIIKSRAVIEKRRVN